MPLDTFLTSLLAAGVFAIVLVRQCITRPFTRRDLILPALGALYLGIRYMYVQDSAQPAAAIIQISATLGMASGLVAGQVVRVWREQASGLVYQYGGWRYAGVVIGLLGVRILWRLVVHVLGIGATVGLLNDAFIAVALGNYFGRSLNVGARALHLLRWNPSAIPSKRALKRGTPSRSGRHASRRP